MLSVEGLCKSFASFAVRDVSFEVAAGEYFVVLGPSGVGKTVVLEIIAGLVTPDAGRIVLDDRDITVEKIQHRSVGLVYQDQALFSHLSVYKNIAYGLAGKGLTRSAIRDRVTDLADAVGVTDLLDRRPGRLSGGESQRVALARTLATQPRCLLLDEPLSSLDTQPRAAMRGLLRTMNREGQTVIHVTHDYEEAVSLASRIAVMQDGHIVQMGTPEAVFHRPKSQFVARFVGIRNVFKGRLERTTRGNGQLAEFVTEGPRFAVLTDHPSGPGHCLIRSDDVVISNTALESSARNRFEGRIVDLVPARLGMEITVDIGVEISALITSASVRTLDLHCGRNVWVNFKASAAEYVGE